MESLCNRLRKHNKIGNVISISITLSNTREVIGGSIKIGHFTQDEEEIFNNCLNIIKKQYNNEKIRKINVSLGNLIDDNFLETSLFDNLGNIYKNKLLNITIDEINNKYNNLTIFKARNSLNNSTYKNRQKLIGGHNAK